MQEMSEAEGEKFARSCTAAGEYPVNLVYHGTYDHILKGYGERLDEQENRLFFDESKANLCLRDYDDGVKGGSALGCPGRGAAPSKQHLIHLTRF
jgi:hypothetical protein